MLMNKIYVNLKCTKHIRVNRSRDQYLKLVEVSGLNFAEINFNFFSI